MAPFLRFRCPHEIAGARWRRAVLTQTALAICAGGAWAQPAERQVISITGKSRSNTASVAGFGELPLSSAPFSASVISLGQLADAGIGGLGDLTRLDAAITDAYNPPGYWSQLAVRGYTLDNRFNYRRDGLPVNAETALPEANKQAIEILKGTTGLQAGTSAPGGLVNLVVKRPQAGVRSAVLSSDGATGTGIALDLGDRVGSEGRLGWRLNTSADRLNSSAHDTRGSRSLLALALDAQVGGGGLLEAEAELSHQSQPSVPGFSLLGGRLPPASSVDPRINLNDQHWSLPVVFDGHTASLRYTQTLTDSLDFVAHGMRQRLRTDDRIAFPFGCSAEGNYSGYCQDGSFDLYDFRSEGEHRDSQALDLSLRGRALWAGIAHRYTVGLMATAFDATFGRQAYNFVGSGTLDGLSIVPADPTLTGENTQRHERSTEWHVQDAMTLYGATSLWLGLRHSTLQRDSVRTDGSQVTHYGQSFTTPWLALSQALGSAATAYASWGQGVESDVIPNRAPYVDAGQALPASKSRQFELGYKLSGPKLDWRLAAFDIVRPAWREIGPCDVALSCVKRADGAARHTGLEAEAEWRADAWSLRGSAQALHARRQGSIDSALNGKRPTNVPAASLKLQGAYNVATLPGLAVLAFVTHEGERMVLPDNSVATAGWTRIDIAARYTQRLDQGRNVVWRAAVDNIANQRAWKESPYQYDHAYLYPLAPRSLHGAVTLNF
jgi:iron complex outermembrane receptor protein